MPIAKLRKKILIVITKSNWGGAQRYVYDLATSLPRTDFDVLVAHGEGNTLSTKLNDAHISTRHIPSLGRDFSFFKDAEVFWNLTKLFRAEKPDIVHLNSSKIGGLGGLAARLSGVRKIIFTVHGFAFNEDRPWLQKKIIGFLSWMTIALSTQVICISKIEYDKASKWPFVRHKLHLIPNGIDTPIFLEEKEARQTLATGIGKTTTFFENKTVVISIGELTKNKSYEYAIPAFKNLNDCVYVIIGAGEKRAELEKMIVEHNLSDRVVLAGFIHNASSLLKATNIFLISSIKEGLPYVILEAGLARLPIVATKVGGIPDVVEDGISGILIEPKNSEVIANAIGKYASDKEFQKSCAVHFEQTMLSHYNKENMIRDTVLVYER